MRAVRLVEIGKPLSLQEIGVPKPKGPQVLIKVEAAGVCHSDVHMRQGRFGNLRIVEDLGVKLPVTLGHEIAGKIEEVGDEVVGYSKGDLVAVNPWQGEGNCYYCRIGEEHLCDSPRWLGINFDGAYAEYVIVPHYKYMYKLRRLNAVEAAPLTCSGITTYRAVRKASLDPTKTLLVVGAGGGLGTMAVQIAKAVSGATIIGVDVREEAVEAAKRAGADYVINASMQDPLAEIRRITESKGVDAVIDLNNSEKTLSVYPKALAKQGKYVMVGLFGADLHYHAPLITLSEIQFVGSLVGNQSDFLGIMRLAEAGKVKPMITKTMKLEEANEAIDNLENFKAIGRQVLIP
ncbi:NAD(P)-dependent alcohol dehydrogenase [Saccharolobus solfataricus]|uniref:NAD-dependent alcohol dehydrogenase n=3 Tax=Saccharolobus solfataricus TaxID=2287 RepID=ADH_SACS2|nr:NAD(P)-dependent alcohol dehydrogenase [Saccharolobus solfataricus]P39462.1 RecName: Full=NAD-dependent alcohol dehydrogenase [Saccharolobus solfataricus P2]1R37_A Chain A, NAD-dependent alcohol dehydrogenase [Saccharolobus solfataricus]1R37_B Chain B, NAD-dependent alcohol dehydrogenase [Saccharolobus solfataricus]BBA54763.1 NAD-dependent alcohol dehydrogenase [synthetic construct]AAB24546.1 NAD(+)-dependent alcohol dehydrogenase [Saccharolobus solfataricus]AAK42665.1 Alcohol dehydrogenas